MPPSNPDAALLAALDSLVLLPRADQPAAALRLREQLTAPEGEAWNAAFGPESLFEAFSASTLARGVYTHNRARLAPIVAGADWRVIEVGGGNGAVWRGWLPADTRGEIVVVDPHPEGARGVADAVPPGVRVTHLAAGVESVVLPEADAAVVSLVLHHVAGRDAAERAAHGLSGPGKLEALRSIGAALRPRGGVLLLNEADIGCEVHVPSGSALLRERLTDSYVRRFGRAIAADLVERTETESVRARWRAIIRDWALGQVAMADVPVAERDVYEMTVTEWLDLLGRAGATVTSCAATDRWMLFWGYVADFGPAAR